MAAAIWWYPDPLGTVEELNLKVPLTERGGPHMVVRSSSADSFTGGRSLNVTGAREKIRIQLLNFTDRTVRTRCVSMINHLQHGGTIGLVEDTSRAWAAFARQAPARGATTVFTETNLLGNLSSSADPGGSEVYLHGPQPRMRYEMQAATSWDSSDGRLIISPGLQWDWTNEAWILVREAGTYPAMRLPREDLNGEFLTHDRENNFSLDLPLETAPQSLQAWADQYDVQLTGDEAGGVSLGELNDSVINSDAGGKVGAPDWHGLL